MVAAGFRVYLLDDYRSTPELSFLVRHKQCHCGIMVTASHNPPSDNAVKVYWSTGGQVLPPHDQAIIDCVEHVEEIAQADFQTAVARGPDRALYRGSGRGIPGDARRGTALAGRATCTSSTRRCTASARRPSARCSARPGSSTWTVYPPHADPDGDFPNVPGHVSNPENPRVFDAMIEHARTTGADLILATDPDCDRMGCAAPLTLQRRRRRGPRSTAINSAPCWPTTCSNGAKRPARLSPQHYLVKTLVTTELIRRIGDSYGVRTCGDLLVGFKWIGGVDRRGRSGRISCWAARSPTATWSDSMRGTRMARWPAC